MTPRCSSFSCAVLAAVSVLFAPASPAADKPVAPKVDAPAVTSAPRATVPSSWVAAEARKLAKAPTISVEDLRAKVRQNLTAGGPASQADIQALVLLVLQQAQKEAAADLRQLQAKMKEAAARKKELREAREKMKDSKDSLSEMSQEDQLALQMAMDRKSKLEQAISNVMKKTSETSQKITENLK